MVQDGLVGIYKMSRDNMKISRYDTMLMLLQTTFVNYDFFFSKYKKEYTCREILSEILPDALNVNRKIGDEHVLIENG